MITTHKIKLDFNLQETIPRIRAVQGDQYSRRVEVSLHSNTVPWMIPEHTTVLIRYRKPNRTVGVYDTLPNGESAFHLEENIITMTIAPDLLTTAGDVSMIISLICGEQVLSTFEMVLEVQANHNTGNHVTGAGGYISGLLPSPKNAQEGQILAVDKIGANGTILALSAIDLPPYNSIQSISQDTEASTESETVYSVNLSDGTQHRFTVKNGADGENGRSAYDYAKDAGYTGTEAEFATKLAKGYPNTSVTEYGAKGDGVTDDTAAFQTALAENRVVYVPGGTYVLNGTLVIRENCGLELSQDTILKFTQTQGNCIEMRGSAVLRGNHAVISAAFGLTGNVISMDTLLDGTDHASIPPYEKACPQWKRQRFVYDVNIIKPNSSGFNRPLSDGVCSGTAIYMSATNVSKDSTDIQFMWAINMSGIRIAGGFSYGIHAINYDSSDGYTDDGWNHDMRIEAVIEGCEIGVALENCNGAHLNVTVQPNTSNPGSTKYAKQGIMLNDSRYVDMMRSRVWDWHIARSDSEEYKHLALYGNCKGLLLDDFLVHEYPNTDIRDQIYTDTPSNFDTMTILQEPGNKHFKSVGNKPYFNDGTDNMRLALESEIVTPADGYFTKTPSFTNLVSSYEDDKHINGNSTATELGYTSTDFIPISGAVHTYRIGGTGISYDKTDEFCRIAWYNADKTLKGSVMSARKMNENQNSIYYAKWTEDDTVAAAFTTDENVTAANGAAYFRISAKGKGKNLIITVDEKQEYNSEWHGEPRRLNDGIKVKAENVVGLECGSGIDVTAEVGQAIIVKAVDENGKPTEWEAADLPEGMSSWNDLADKPFNIVELMPETQFVYDESMGYFVAQTDFELVAGRTYIVNWNGAEYTATAKTVMFNGMCMIAVGNEVITGGEDNGLPFVVGRILFEPYLKGIIAAVPMDGSTAVSVSIKGIESSALYDTSSTLMLDARGTHNSQGDDKGVFVLEKIYATPQQIMDALAAGKKPCFLAPYYKVTDGLLEGVQSIQQVFVYNVDVMDDIIIWTSEAVLPIGIKYAFMTQYNGDGTYIPVAI